MAPVHTNERDTAIDQVARRLAQRRVQEFVELPRSHLTGAHRKLAVLVSP